jgi:hypothetical protein
MYLRGMSLLRSENDLIGHGYKHGAPLEHTQVNSVRTSPKVKAQ